MSDLDKELNKKFGKSNKKLHDAYKAFGLEDNMATLHGHDVRDGKTYWDAVENSTKFSKGIDENGKILEHDAANPDNISMNETPYFKNEENKEFDVLIQKMKYLSRREKEIIQLLWEGKIEADIGIILGIKQTTVSTILNRARRKIKSCS